MSFTQKVLSWVNLHLCGVRSAVLLLALIGPLLGGTGAWASSPHEAHFMFCSPGCRVIFPGSLSDISVGGAW